MEGSNIKPAEILVSTARQKQGEPDPPGNALGDRLLAFLKLSAGKECQEDKLVLI